MLLFAVVWKDVQQTAVRHLNPLLLPDCPLRKCRNCPAWKPAVVCWRRGEILYFGSEEKVWTLIYSPLDDQLIKIQWLKALFVLTNYRCHIFLPLKVLLCRVFVCLAQLKHDLVAVCRQL